MTDYFGDERTTPAFALVYIKTGLLRGYNHFNIWSILAMMLLLKFSFCSNVGGNDQGKIISSQQHVHTEPVR